MAPPTNLSALTAIDLGTFPFDVTQQVDDAGTTYTVWYKFTAPADALPEVSIWARRQGGGLYAPTTNSYTGSASSPDLYIVFGGSNVQTQIPVVGGTTYFLEFPPNGGNPAPAILRIRGKIGPNLTIPINSICVPDDTPDFPTAFVSSTNPFSVLGYRTEITCCEKGDIITDGHILTDASFSVSGTILNYYSPSLVKTEIDTGITASTFPIRTCLGTQNWCVGYPGGGLTHAKLLKVTSAGVLSTIASDLGTAGCTAVAFSNDESLIYMAGLGTSSSAVMVWDVGGGAFTTDLIGAQVGYIVTDILVLSNDKIVIAWHRTSVGTDLIKVLQADGTILASLDETRAVDHICYDTTANQFWAWIQPDSNHGKSTFQKYDDTITPISSVDQSIFEAGVFQGTASTTPDSLFGTSFSCPFFLTTVEIPALTPPDTTHSGIYEVKTSPSATNDTIFTGDNTTLAEKIPDPTVILFPAGD